ncbi:hypothetical protein ACJX0J_022053, partial [Zea mays]
MEAGRNQPLAVSGMNNALYKKMTFFTCLTYGIEINFFHKPKLDSEKLGCFQTGPKPTSIYMFQWLRAALIPHIQDTKYGIVSKVKGTVQRRYYL